MQIYVNLWVINGVLAIGKCFITISSTGNYQDWTKISKWSI